LLAVVAATAQPRIRGTWLEARSPNFHVVTDSQPEKIKALTEKLERFHQVMEQSFLGPQAHPVVPSTLILMQSWAALRPFSRLSPDGKPVPAEGFLQPGPDRMYLAVNLGAATPERTAFHEYTHLLVNLKFGSLPLWLSEGLATYFGGIRLEGTRFALGEWRPDYETTLRQSGFIPLHVLMEVDADSPYYNAESRMERFYAESWLLVHYLFHGDQGLYRARLELFIELLRDQVPQEDALEEAFGLNYAGLESRLRRYHAHHSFSPSYGELGALGSTVPVEMAPLSPALAQVYLADLWLNAGRVEEARQLLERVSDSSVPPTEGLLRLGRIELEENRPLAAEKYFQSALALQPEDYRLRYYAARAISEGRGGVTGTPEARLAAAREIVELLGPVVGAGGQFPEAQRLLRQAELIRRNEQWLQQVRKERELSRRDGQQP
jgi:tetratricopeptide (TPR) repeat protein